MDDRPLRRDGHPGLSGCRYICCPARVRTTSTSSVRDSPTSSVTGPPIGPIGVVADGSLKLTVTVADGVGDAGPTLTGTSEPRIP